MTFLLLVWILNVTSVWLGLQGLGFIWPVNAVLLVPLTYFIIRRLQND